MPEGDHMRNSHLPLIQALKNRMKPKEDPMGPMEAPRTFELKHDEVPGLAGRKVGEGITVHLKGMIHSQSADGHAVMNVDSVHPTETTPKENQAQA
jgi:hypothetical protein